MHLKEIYQQFKRFKQTRRMTRADFTIFIGFYIENGFYTFSNAAANGIWYYAGALIDYKWFENEKGEQMISTEWMQMIF